MTDARLERRIRAGGRYGFGLSGGGARQLVRRSTRSRSFRAGARAARDACSARPRQCHVRAATAMRAGRSMRRSTDHGHGGAGQIPQPLIDQLAPRGRLVIPVGEQGRPGADGGRRTGRASPSGGRFRSASCRSRGASSTRSWNDRTTNERTIQVNRAALPGRAASQRLHLQQLDQAAAARDDAVALEQRLAFDRVQLRYCASAFTRSSSASPAGTSGRRRRARWRRRAAFRAAGAAGAARCGRPRPCSGSGSTVATR